jgi:hypothetical protein
MHTSFNAVEVTMDLSWHVAQLADSRALLKEYKAQQKRLEDIIKAEVDAKYSRLRAAVQKDIDRTQAETDRFYDQTVLLACQNFEKDGVKAQHKAVSVGEYTVLEYDQDAALELAKTKGQWLKLDVRSFKKDARALLELSEPDPQVAAVVTMRTEVRARVKSDLSQWSK